MNIGVLGLGYVGTVTAACLAKLQHTVLGVDIDQRKVEDINNGKAPFFEPGLETLVWEQVQAGRLQATMKVEDITICDVVIICVGTPVVNSEVNLEYLNKALESIKSITEDEDAIVVIRSTVPPGTCEKIQADCTAKIIFVPEFLREGNAIEDFENPGSCAVGCKDKVTSVAATVVGQVLFPSKGFKVVDWNVAEMLKYACNSFHALKICFANEIDAIATSQGVDGKKVMELLKADKKLNSSPAYLRPGFAFGGSCLPKDIRALRTMAADGGVHIELISSIMRSNKQQIMRAVNLIEDINVDKIGIVGLAFKEDTDDLRSSPTIRLIANLITQEVKVYAPRIDIDKLFGVNLEEFNDYEINLVSLKNLLGWAEVVVITHKVTKVVEEMIYTSSLKIIDLSGHYHNVL